MQSLINYIESIVHLTDDAIEELHKRTSIESYPKNTFILRSGQRCDKIWFLIKGMVRKYYLHNGKEITTWIHTENEIFTSLQSYANKSLTEEFLEAVEDCEIIGISRTNSEKLALFPQFVTFSNVLMEREFANIDKHSRAFGQKDAKSKYEYLFEIAPEIVRRAKQSHIASILGISPETLSRVRSLR